MRGVVGGGKEEVSINTQCEDCLVLGQFSLLSLLDIQMGQCLAGVGKLDAVDDLLASADRSRQHSQGPEQKGEE